MIDLHEQAWLDHYRLNQCPACGAEETAKDDDFSRRIWTNILGYPDSTISIPCPVCRSPKLAIEAIERECDNKNLDGQDHTAKDTAMANRWVERVIASGK